MMDELDKLVIIHNPYENDFLFQISGNCTPFAIHFTGNTLQMYSGYHLYLDNIGSHFIGTTNMARPVQPRST